MTKQKLIPIISHNYKGLPCISPEAFIQYQTDGKKISSIKKNFPKFIIITSQDNIVSYLRKSFRSKPYKNWCSHRSELYAFNIGGRTIGIINVGLGAPQAVTLMELLIAYGAKKFIIIGSLGAINKELKIGDLVLVGRAIRDEGISYHYLAPGKYIQSTKSIYGDLKKILIKKNILFKDGTIWTSDAFFRETIHDILKYQKEGVLGVEMKTAALFSVAKFRKVAIGGLFYVSDSLATLKWNPHLQGRLVKKAQKIVVDIVISYLAERL